MTFFLFLVTFPLIFNQPYVKLTLVKFEITQLSAITQAPLSASALPDSKNAAKDLANGLIFPQHSLCWQRSRC